MAMHPHDHAGLKRTAISSVAGKEPPEKPAVAVVQTEPPQPSGGLMPRFSCSAKIQPRGRSAISVYSHGDAGNYTPGPF